MHIARAATAAAAALSSGVIVPLYIYPDSGCTAWAPVINAIAAHPTVPFWVIVNPNSGPGSKNTQPDSSYQTCVTSLKATSNPNVHVVGYVRTTYGSRTSSSVTADINTYSGWKSAYRPSGIFFDEAATAANKQSLYATWAKQARTDFGSASTIILNPGTATDASYFSIADLIVTEEESYASFSNSQLTLSSSKPASKQAIILHTGPSTTNNTLLKQLIKTDKVKAVFMTNYVSAEAYSNIPSDWANFVNDVQAGTK